MDGVSSCCEKPEPFSFAKRLGNHLPASGAWSVPSSRGWPGVSLEVGPHRVTIRAALLLPAAARTRGAQVHCELRFEADWPLAVAEFRIAPHHRCGNREYAAHNEARLPVRSTERSGPLHDHPAYASQRCSCAT